MAEGTEPRLYHNTAVLLPNSRVFVSGSNSARATFTPSDTIPPSDASLQGQPKPDLGRVNLNMYFINDGPVARGEQGMLTTPTENWTAEIFSPPYMFIDAGRQATIENIAPQKAVDYQYKASIGGKDFYLLHSGQTYEIQLNILPPAKSCSSTKPSLQLIKLPSATHGWENGQQFVNPPFGESREHEVLIRFKAPGAKQANIPPAYYMMFYVDCHGKPSVASMVRFDDNARAP